MESTLDLLRHHGGRLLGRLSRAAQQFVPPLADLVPVAPRRSVADTIIAPAPDVAIVNPGNLTLHTHVPAGLADHAPLVVLLHGCGQDPESFADETGWRALADRHGFVLLMPGQTDGNNPQRCFNWFRPGDMGRDHGEAGSIASMTRATLARHRCDPARVFITGLSAGGAMTACLLASYPDLFAAGAVVAGLPAGAARNVMAAMSRMAGRGRHLSAAEWTARAHAMAPPGFAGTFPSVSIWQGSADPVVAPENARLLAEQWTGLHAIALPPTQTEVHPGITCDSWGGPKATVQLWTIADAGHVYPVRESQGVSAAAEIARFWGILT